MKKTRLVQILNEVNRQFEAGEITSGQYDAFMARVRDKFENTPLEDCVWERPLRPITPPRPHKNAAWKKDLHID